MKKKILNVAFCLALATGPMAFAQDAASAEDQADAPKVEQTKLIEMIRQGGWTMWPLGAFSLLMVTFIVQNALVLREKVLLRPDLLPDFFSLMKEKNVVGAHELCKETDTLFTYVFAAGLERCPPDGQDIDFTKVKEAVEEASTEQITQYMKAIDYLSIIGAVSPMLGLLGTVSGMIKAFQTIGSMGMGKPEVLAGNIGEALVTTATGLIIAIPAMLFYYFFRNNFIKFTATLGRNIGALLDTLQTGQLPLGFDESGRTD